MDRIRLIAMDLVPFLELVVALEVSKDFSLGPQRLHDVVLPIVGSDDELMSETTVIGGCQLLVLS